MKLGDVVRVIKNPLRTDVVSAYSECKFLVLPSRWELSPLTPLEGFAFKKTVISTNAHGIPFTITGGENCILVESDNPQALATAITDLLVDGEKCTKYGLAGYRLVQQVCNAKAMAESTLDVYKQVINR